MAAPPLERRREADIFTFLVRFLTYCQELAFPLNIQPKNNRVDAVATGKPHLRGEHPGVETPMDLHHLEHFLAVVEQRTFTRAAEKVLRTQSAVSQSIKKLEDELGASLFVRDGHDVFLTDAGRRLVQHARNLVRLRDQALSELSDVRRLGEDSLSIAAQETAALYLLPGPLVEYLRRFKTVRVGVYRASLSDIPLQVLDRQVDLGFVSEEPELHSLQSTQIRTDRMILIASPRHPIAKRRNVRIRDLGNEEFVIHHQCASTMKSILRLFDEHRTAFKAVAQLWSFENVKDFVRQDVGLAIVPGITVARELQERSVVRVPVDELHIPRKTLMVFRNRRDLSDATRGFISLLRSGSWPERPILGSARPTRPGRVLIAS